jgi:hypothetical protein
MGLNVSAQVGEDGTFRFRDVMADGVLHILDPGWAIARVLERGRDITDVPMDFQSEPIRDLEVTVTNRFAAVSGTVRSTSGQPLANATVIAYGADSTSSIYLTRTSRAVRSDDNGTFTISNLLPGRYLIVAATEVPGHWLEPPALSVLRPAATPITLLPDGRATLQLTAIR